MYMEHRIEFDKLISMRMELNERLVALETTLSEMKDKYKEFTKNNFKKIYLYSLDSFFFQYKILHVEFEHYKRFLALINNRMYGDYYKLFMIIISQSKESNLCINIELDDVLVYKDLDPMYDYTIDNVTAIFDKIVIVMEQLRELYRMNSETILSNNSNNGVGFSIAAFFTTLKYENIILNEQVRMYIDFIKFYQASQLGHLSKALVDVARFSDEINGKVLVNYQVDVDALVKPKLIEEPDTIREPEPVQEPDTIREPEPVQELVNEQVQEPVTEPVVETETEQVQEPVTEQVVEQVVEQVQEQPVQEQPVQEQPVQEQPVQEQPVQEQPVQEQPVQEQPVQEQPVQEQPVQEQPVQEQPVQEQPVQEQPVQEQPVQEQPVQEQPVQEQPVQEQPVQEQPVQEQPVQEQSAIKPKNNTPKSRGRPKMAIG